MRLCFVLLLLSATVLPAGLFAQTQTAISPARNERDAPKTGRKVLPDPDLFDGSQLPPEKQPEFGMLGEFELPGGDERTDRVGLPPLPLPSLFPQTGEAGGGGLPGLPSLLPSTGSGSSSLSIPTLESGGNAAAEPAGIRAQELKGGQAMEAGEQPVGKPRNIGFGDASLQIEPAGSSAGVQEIVGTEAEAGTRQYKKPTAQGQQSNPANTGVEKGRTMPSGL